MLSDDRAGRLRVLVVDDEQPILEELRLFGWKDWGAELIATLTNGAEALDFCTDNEVDLIISDVVMPVMDGLELLNRIHKVFPKIQFILLTCHESFQYAQEALRSGALDYIVKSSMNDEDLASAINKAKTSIEMTSHIKSSMEEKHRRDLSNLFRQLIGANPDCESIQGAIQRLLPFEFPFQLPIFYIHFTDEFAPITQHEILALLYENHLPKQFECEMIPLSRQQLLGISGEWTNDRIQAYASGIEKILVQNMSYPESGIHVYAVVGNPLWDIRQLRTYLLASRKWAELIFFNQEQVLFHPPERSLSTWPKEEQQKIFEECRERLGDTQALFAFLQERLNNASGAAFLEPVLLKRFLLWWFTSLLEREISLEQMAAIGEKVNNALSLDEAIDSLQYFWLQLRGEKAAQHPEIRRALEMIHKHVDRPVTLQLVSRQVGLSPHYLSRLFHAETGKSFSKYVNEMKLQRAAKLLRESNMKVYEVSDSIGISNYRYFVMLFKKQLGMTPLEYRRNVTAR